MKLCLTLTTTAADSSNVSTSSTSAAAAQQRRVVLEFSPNATVRELRLAAQQAYHCDDDNDDDDASVGVVVELYVGYPPQRLDSDQKEDDTMSLHDAGLQHQDRIAVTLTRRTAVVVGGVVPGAALAPQDTTTTTTTTTPTTTRNRRAAAVAATTRIAHEIQQQQQAVAAVATSTKTKKKATQSTTTKNNTARHFAALMTQKASTSTSATTGPPRRLRDGSVVVATPKRRKRTSNHPVEQGNNSNLLEALVGTSNNNNNNNNNNSRLMRQGWRAAVQSVYEQNQAVARIATRMDQITWQQNNESNNDNNDNDTNAPPLQQQWTVSYPKGVQGRKTTTTNNNNNNCYTDTQVDVLDTTVLAAVVQQIHNTHPEGLRAENLALLSPRVLWSLIYNYQSQSNNNNSNTITTTTINSTMTVGEVIPLALRQLQPQLDWSFLRRRPTMLSAKARENLRQQQEQSSSQQQHDHWQAAAQAMEAVEQALRGEYVRDATHHDTTTTTTSRPITWTVTTPDEMDDDELLECLGAATADPDPSTDAAPAVWFPRPAVVQALHELGLHNWRELANVEHHQNDDDDDSEENDFYTRLLQVLNQQQQNQQRTTEKNDSQPTIPNEASATIPVSRTTVQAWIDYAQWQSVQEIMVECCDSNVDAVDVLIETVNCGTPRDLTLWQSIVPVLQREIICRSHNIDNEATTHDWFSQLPVWCHRAQCALEQLPWLQQYVTPVQTT